MIRRARSTDLDAVADLHRASILELCKSHYSPPQLKVWTAALQPAGYEMLLNTRTMLVAERPAGELLGFGVVDVSASFINAVYLAPATVGCGVGRHLLTALEASVSSERVWLHATLNAVGFYAHLGYIEEGPVGNRFSDGTELPCLKMSKRLSPASPATRSTGCAD
jgi:putative acetyltransferase